MDDSKSIYIATVNKEGEMRDHSNIALTLQREGQKFYLNLHVLSHYGTKELAPF